MCDPKHRQAGAELITPQMEMAGICALEEALGVLAPHQIVAQVYIAMQSARDHDPAFLECDHTNKGNHHVQD